MNALTSSHVSSFDYTAMFETQSSYMLYNYLNYHIIKSNRLNRFGVYLAHIFGDLEYIWHIFGDYLEHIYTCRFGVYLAPSLVVSDLP